MSKPQLERIYVAADGSVKAVYTDNSLLLLSSDAASFTRVSAEGVRTVHLTECCLSRWKPLLAEVLAFRNQYLDVPFFPSWLQQQLRRDQHHEPVLFSTGYPITDTTWPATAEEAVEQGLVHLTGGDNSNNNLTLQLYSCCGSAFITLQHTAGLRFAVCYPLLLSHDPASNTYSYLQHTQVFSRSQFPPRWKHPLQTAVAAADMAAHSCYTQPLQQQHQEQWPRASTQQLLHDVTNRFHNLLSASISPSACKQQQQQRLASTGSTCSSPPAAAGASASGVQLPAPAPAPAPPPLSSPKHTKQWCPPGSPGSASAALYAVAEHQQQQQQHEGMVGRRLLPLHHPHGSPLSSTPRPTAAVPAAVRFSSSSSSLARVVRLPTMPGALPAAQHSRQLQAHTLLQSEGWHHLHPAGQAVGATPPSPPSPSRNSSSSMIIGAASRDRGWSRSHTASALAEALGRHQQGGSSSSSSCGVVGSWWLEPHLLLPRDEVLHMVWSPDATLIFLEDTFEVEVWLHADDSCLFSFQGGAFLTHLQPHQTRASAAWQEPPPDAAAGSPGTSAAAAAADGGGEAVEGDAAAFPSTPPAAAAAATTTSQAARFSLQQQQQQQQTQSCAFEAAPSQQQAFRSGTRAAAVGAGAAAGAASSGVSSRVYAASTLPAVDQLVPSLCPEARRCGVVLPLGRVATEALRFRSTMAQVKASAAAAAGAAAHNNSSRAQGGYEGVTQQPHALRSTGLLQHHPQLSMDVVEDQEVPGVGHFTAYADGRVRVVFEDRTILSLTTAAAAGGGSGVQQVQLILPDGSKQQVAASRPVGVEQYVQAALEFATWSAHTPIQRAAALRSQALVAAELRSSARMAAICEWGSNPRHVPAAAAAAAAAVLNTTATAVGGLLTATAAHQEEQEAWSCSSRSVEAVLQANSELLKRL